VSTTGSPVAFVWGIRQVPQDEVSLLAMPIDDRQLGVLLFTQREFAEEFARTYPDIPAGAVLATVEAPDLARVLTEQAQQGCTHVVTDPILGSPSYLAQRTLTIGEYLTGGVAPLVRNQAACSPEPAVRLRLSGFARKVEGRIMRG
jgi:hypothetical protein